MYCAKCGKQIPDNAVFCDNCGADQRQKAAVQSSHTHQRAEKPPKQRKKLSGKAKAVISICVVLAIIIGLAAAGLSIYFNSPAREVMEQLDKGKYDKALKIYQNDVSDSTIHNALFKYLLDDELSDKLKAYTEGTLKYEEALPYLLAVVNMEVIDDAGSRLAEAISGRCEAIINAYSGGTLSFEAAEEELCFTEEYESLIGITAVTEKHNELIALNKSKENFESGERYFTSGDYEDAIEYFGRVSENSAYYEQAQTMIASAVSNISKENFESGESYLMSGNYEDAIEYFGRVSENSTYYEQAQTMIAAAISQYRAEMLDNARSRVQAGDYVGAIALLETALDVISEDAEITAAIDAYRSEYFATVKNDALTRSTNLSADGDFVEAMDILRNALDIVGDDAELQRAYDSCVSSYVEHVAYEVNAILDEDWNAAHELIAEALNNLPSNGQLIELNQEIMRVQPIELNALTVVDSNGLAFAEGFDGIADSYGNIYYDYTPYLWAQDLDNERHPLYVMYNLSKNYTYFSCTIAPCTEWGSTIKTRVVIYLDDEKVFEKQMMKTTAPFKVELDVTDSTLLKIYFLEMEATYGRAGIIIANGIVKK